ncbi:PIN domain-containing protein [Candidatus Pacearchaeota archaeon]|nr:PIN domain-containing protein [Candidatus Pacearchaeota archaeon]
MEEAGNEEVKEDEKVSYFFDSYAVIEILKENPNYAKFKEQPITIVLWNLAEIYYHCINSNLEKEADNLYSKFRKSVVEIDDETLQEAMKFKKEHKKQDLSYADCIGYIYAKKHNMVFLTGDKEFENLENVEFVK